MDLVGVKAHDIRAFAASKAFHGPNHASLPLEISQHIHQILPQRSCQTRPIKGLLPLGRLHCSTEGDASFRPCSTEGNSGGGGGGAQHREPPRRRVSVPSDTVERGLYPFEGNLNFIFIKNLGGLGGVVVRDLASNL